VDAACPLCGAPLDRAQEWCLHCGAAARTRLAAPPTWKAPIVTIAVLIVLALGVLAASLVKLSAGPGTTKTLPAVTTTITASSPAAPTTATTPTTATPGASTIPRTSTGAGAVTGGTPGTPTTLAPAGGSTTGTTTPSTTTPAASGTSSAAAEEALRKAGFAPRTKK